MKCFAIIFIVCISQVRVFSSQSISSKSSANGTDRIPPGKYPYHVVIQYSRKSNSFFLGEGVLIEKNYILTAAQCVQSFRYQLNSLEVLAGLVSTEDVASQENTQKRVVTEMKISPVWYDSKKKYGDIAVLKVSPPFESNEFVREANSYGRNRTDNTTVQLVGYGDSDDLSAKRLVIPANKECHNTTYQNETLGTFCTKTKQGYIFWNSSYAGAPIVSVDSDEEIYGLSASNNKSSYTSIAHHLKWIESVTNVTRNRKAENDGNATETTTESNRSNSTTTTSNYSNSTSSTSTARNDNATVDENSEFDFISKNYNTTNKTETEFKSIHLNGNSSQPSNSTLLNGKFGTATITQAGVYEKFANFVEAISTYNFFSKTGNSSEE